jgi:hypothetical protein
MDRRRLNVYVNREARRISGLKRKEKKSGEKYTTNIFMIFTFHQTLSLLSDGVG